MFVIKKKNELNKLIFKTLIHEAFRSVNLLSSDNHTILKHKSIVDIIISKNINNKIIE